MTASFEGPQVEDYLGIMQLGTEEFRTDEGVNVTFTADTVILGVKASPYRGASADESAREVISVAVLILSCIMISVMM